MRKIAVTRRVILNSKTGEVGFPNISSHAPYATNVRTFSWHNRSAQVTDRICGARVKPAEARSETQGKDI